MPTIKNTRLVYSTDPDVEVESRKERASRRQKKTRTRPAVPQDGVIRIFLERKGRRGKSVTVLRGIPGDVADQKALLKRLKSALGTGGALKDGVIEIQGDHRDRILAMLSQAGYQAKKAGG